MRTSILVTLLVLTGAANAQVAGPAKDPAAVAKLDKADTLLYSPQRSGLKDLSYVQTLTNLPNVEFRMRWIAPDLKKVVITPSPGAPAAASAIVQSMGPALENQALMTLDMMTGKESKRTYADDEIQLTSDGSVKIVAHSAKTKKIFSSSIISYDAKGLPVTMRSETSAGLVEMAVTYESKGEHHFVKEVRSKSATGEALMAFTYQEVSGMSFPKTIVTNLPGGTPGRLNSTTQEFKDVFANSGLKPEDLKD